MTRSALRATRRERASKPARQRERESLEVPLVRQSVCASLPGMGFACCRYHRPPTTTTLSSPSFHPLMQVYGKASWLRTLPRAHTYRETERAESPPMQCASPASFLVPDPNWLLRRRRGVSSPLQRTPAARCSCSCSSPCPPSTSLLHHHITD
ncbi:hypothetical protein K456DRAFT_1131975 [Colletotrichum gloeosporioides 23]|nr:hypothetical protein K456DRAFT_1131975 [Colletotrichum gloeosporioides 23]